MRIFIFLVVVPSSERRRFRCNSLHQIEICIAQNEPFCARGLKIDLDTRMCALPLAIQDHAIPEFAVPHALAKADSQLGARRR